MNLNQTELKKIKRIGLIAPLIFLIIGMLHFRKGHFELAIFLYILAVVFFVMTWFFPIAFKKTTRAIGETITRLLLSIVFYIMITPYAIIMRLFGKDPLDKRIEKEKNSYWIDKERSADGTAGYERQF